MCKPINTNVYLLNYIVLEIIDNLSSGLLLNGPT